VPRATARTQNAKAGDHAIDVITGLRIDRILFADAVRASALGIDLLGLDLPAPALVGAHQIDNAATAVACIERLRAAGFAIGDRDVRKGLPFDSDSVDEILMSHFLEHLTGEEAIELLAECYRVLKPGAAVTVVVPLNDPFCFDHRQVFEARSFDTLFRPETADYFQQAFRWEHAATSEEKDARGTNLRVVMRAAK